MRQSGSVDINVNTSVSVSVSVSENVDAASKPPPMLHMNLSCVLTVVRYFFSITLNAASNPVSLCTPCRTVPVHPTPNTAPNLNGPTYSSVSPAGVVTVFT